MIGKGINGLWSNWQNGFRCRNKQNNKNCMIVSGGKNCFISLITILKNRKKIILSTNFHRSCKTILIVILLLLIIRTINYFQISVKIIGTSLAKKIISNFYGSNPVYPILLINVYHILNITYFKIIYHNHHQLIPKTINN
jgi:hypothetical protein